VVQPLGDLFIRLLVMAAIPLVFFNLLAGVTSLADLRTLGRLAAKILSYYVVTTTLALIFGLTSMNLLKPGLGMTLTEEPGPLGEVPSVVNVLLDLFPENAFEAFATGKVSQIVVFALFLGIATVLLPEERRSPLRSGFGLVAELLRKLVDVVMWFGPIGIGALAAATLGEYGSQIFGPLALFIGGIWLAQVAMVMVYLTLLGLLTPHSPVRFLKETGTLWATTVATCSSLASLAVAFEVAEDRLHLPQRIYSFTLPLGAQLNKDGTSIMLAAVLLFTAQAAGVEFDLASQITIILIGLVLSEGSGGIPGGGLVIALIFVQAFSLPLEIAAIVAGIYRLIDMGSTTINVMGDMVGTAIVSHSERHNAEAAA
jgi:Na+/H+-dicarboxylate symporter